MVDRARRLGRWFLALDSLLVILGFFVVMPMISLRFVDQLGWAAGVVGLALGLRQLTQQGLGVFGGSLADKFGARPLIVCGMLLRALGFASLAYAQVIPPFFGALKSRGHAACAKRCFGV